MTKIEAIRKTIYNLENDVYEYAWTDPDNCNCGILARTILGGKKPNDCGYENSPARSGKGHWSSNSFCMTTNLPLPKVFKALRDTGFTHEELTNLEYYGDERIARKLGLTIERRGDGRPFGYIEKDLDDKHVVIAYLKAWLEILEKENPQPQKEELYKDITRELSVLPEDKIETDIVVKACSHNS